MKKRIYIEGTDNYCRVVIAALRESAELIVVRGKNSEELIELKEEFNEIESSNNSFTDQFDIVVNCSIPDVGFEKIVPIPPKIFNNAKLIFDPISEYDENSITIKQAIALKTPYVTGKQFINNAAIVSFELWTNRSLPPAILNGQ